MQAADILTKPFTDAEKWNFAVNLLGHRNGISTGKTSKPNPHSKSQVTHTLPAASEESSGVPAVGPKPSRLIVEVCCSKNSKLSDCSRPNSKDCLVYHNSQRRLIYCRKTLSKPGSLDESTRIPMGDLLKNLEIPGIGSVHTRLRWERGLNTIVQTAKEAIDNIVLDNFYKGNPGRQILVLVGWSGNHVHGDFG